MDLLRLATDSLELLINEARDTNNPIVLGALIEAQSVILDADRVLRRGEQVRAVKTE